MWPGSLAIGPHNWQLISTARTLNHVNQLVVTACGNGKTATVYLPLLVLEMLAADPRLPRHGIRVPKRPVVLIVTPLSDLGHSQVSKKGDFIWRRGMLTSQKVEEMRCLGITAVALDVDSIQSTYEEGKDLLKEVRECKWGVVIVSPKRLTSLQFDQVMRTSTFRDNLMLYIVDKVHVMAPWSLTFCKCYGQLGKVLMRIRADVPTLALTATSIMGNEAQVMESLGIWQYQTLCRSCKCANLQLAFCTLLHGLDGHEFPDIAWVIHTRKKTIIYCSTIDLGHRVTSYLWRLLPRGEDCYVCIQEYNGLTWAESNAETIHSFSANDDVFMIVATIKCRMGVDIRNIEVSINLGLPESAEAIQGEYSVLPERNLVT